MSGYREPGRIYGWAIFVLGLAAIACIQHRPWENNWEDVRVMFGQPRTRDATGNWEVVQSIVADPTAFRLVPAKTRSATIHFLPGEQFRSEMTGKDSILIISGVFRQRGANVALTSLRPNGQGSKIPPQLVMKLSWTSPNDIVASIGKQTLYLHRLADGKAHVLEAYEVKNGRLVAIP